MRSSGDVPNERDSFLRLHEVEAVYDGAIVGLRGVTFDVAKGAVVALLGANGAGKTTTLRAISNLLGAENGAVSGGTITWEQHSVLTTHPSQLVARGLAQVLEGRQCFQHLTVEENLLTGGFVRRLSRSQLRAELDRAYTRFPRLKERRHIRAGLTSGGEQQMVAIGRALMTGPRLMLLDEPSMGLAPRVVHEIFEIMRRLNSEEGVTFLVSEQNANIALHYVDTAHVLENGRVVVSGTAAELSKRVDVKDIYLGGGATKRREGRSQFAI
jgi:branched-chain amino acid transport system ATP-binding protein